MYSRVKYVVSNENKIIVFSELFTHSEFSRYKPISAGFISFGVNKQGNPTCTCYGESVSLGLKSREIDTDLAKRQLNMLDDY